MSKFTATFLVWFCFLVNCALAKVEADPVVHQLSTPLPAVDVGVLTRKQAGIWIPIIFAIISISAVYALYSIDDIKNRDTILYAKFLANLKDK